MRLTLSPLLFFYILSHHIASGPLFDINGHLLSPMRLFFVIIGDDLSCPMVLSELYTKQRLKYQAQFIGSLCVSFLIIFFKHLHLFTFLYRDYLFIFLRGISIVPRQATFYTVKSTYLTLNSHPFIHYFLLTLNPSLMLLLEDINNSPYLHLLHLNIMNKADCLTLYYLL